MQYAQTATDPLARLSELPYFPRADLGQLPMLPGIIAGAARSIFSAGESTEGEASTDQSVGMPGSRTLSPSAPRQPTSLSTVSTAVVTQVSPQISPVMSQQQSSPGATVGADPTQFMPGGLSAEQAMTPYGSWGMPGFPTNQPGISPMQPYTYGPSGRAVALDPYTGGPITGGYVQPRAPVTAPVNIGASTAGIPWLPIVLVGGVAALALLLPKRRKKAS